MIRIIAFAIDEDGEGETLAEIVEGTSARSCWRLLRRELRIVWPGHDYRFVIEEL